MNQTFSERWAARIAKQHPAIGWTVVLVWAALMGWSLWQRWSDERLTVLEAGALVLLWALLVGMTFVFGGFRRLLAARDRQIEELKSSTQNLPAVSRPSGM